MENLDTQYENSGTPNPDAGQFSTEAAFNLLSNKSNYYSNNTTYTDAIINDPSWTVEEKINKIFTKLVAIKEGRQALSACKVNGTIEVNGAREDCFRIFSHKNLTNFVHGFGTRLHLNNNGYSW